MYLLLFHFYILIDVEPTFVVGRNRVLFLDHMRYAVRVLYVYQVLIMLFTVDRCLSSLWSLTVTFGDVSEKVCITDIFSEMSSVRW